MLQNKNIGNMYMQQKKPKTDKILIKVILKILTTKQ